MECVLAALRPRHTPGQSSQISTRALNERRTAPPLTYFGLVSADLGFSQGDSPPNIQPHLALLRPPLGSASREPSPFAAVTTLWCWSRSGTAATPLTASWRGSSPTPQPSPRTPRPHRGPPSHPPEEATTGLASSPASISACTWPASYGGASWDNNSRLSLSSTLAL